MIGIAQDKPPLMKKQEYVNLENKLRLNNIFFNYHKTNKSIYLYLVTQLGLCISIS